MYYSMFEVFSIGIGPSSSHTVGPMKAGKRFSDNLKEQNKLSKIKSVKVYLYGSLALTGVGHGTLNAVVYGLAGFEAESIDLTQHPLEKIKAEKKLNLAGEHLIKFNFDKDIILEKETFLKEHSNGLKFCALDAKGKTILEETYFSVGGGTIARLDEIKNRISRPAYPVPFPFEENIKIGIFGISPSETTFAFSLMYFTSYIIVFVAVLL